MATAQLQNLENRVGQLERLIGAFIRQEKDEDWLDDPKLIQKLDQIAEEKSISEKDLIF